MLAPQPRHMQWHVCIFAVDILNEIFALSVSGVVLLETAYLAGFLCAASRCIWQGPRYN